MSITICGALLAWIYFAAAAALTFGRAIFVELPGPRWAGNPEPAADAKL